MAPIRGVILDRAVCSQKTTESMPRLHPLNLNDMDWTKSQKVRKKGSVADARDHVPSGLVPRGPGGIVTA